MIVTLLEDQKYPVDEDVKLIAGYRLRDSTSDIRMSFDDVRKSFEDNRVSFYRIRKTFKDIHKSFRDMHKGIWDFQARIDSYTEETDNKLATVMDKLRDDIRRLSNTSRTAGMQYDLLVADSDEDEPPLPQNMSGGQSVSELRPELNDYSRRRLEVVDQNLNVAATMKIDELTQLVDNFSVIWQLIENNAMFIDEKSELIGSSGLELFFYRRLSHLPGEYRDLMEALDLYAAALPEIVGNPFLCQ